MNSTDQDEPRRSS